MKATFTFDLPDEQEDFDTMVRANSMACLLFSFDNWLREQIKYMDHPEPQASVYDEVRQKLWDMAADDGVDLR